jgi:type IV pilus assembly protein PilA
MTRKHLTRRRIGATVDRSRGLTILELLAVVTLIGILATVVLARFAGRDDTAKKNACHIQRANIELQAQIWYRNKGSYPSNPLASSLGADATYIPDLVIPTCPVDGTTYTINTTTGQVTGHDHD